MNGLPLLVGIKDQGWREVIGRAATEKADGVVGVGDDGADGGFEVLGEWVFWHDVGETAGRAGARRRRAGGGGESAV